MMDKPIEQEVLEKYKTVAVYGMSGNPDKPAYYVPAFAQSRGYRIIPINPRGGELLGEKAYSQLADIPDRIEILNVFRRSEKCLEVVEEAIQRKKEKGDIEVIWLQLGITCLPGQKLAEQHDITFIQDRCMLVELKKLV